LDEEEDQKARTNEQYTKNQKGAALPCCVAGNAGNLAAAGTEFGDEKMHHHVLDVVSIEGSFLVK
jgi:hypothetical protein